MMSLSIREKNAKRLEEIRSKIVGSKNYNFDSSVYTRNSSGAITSKTTEGKTVHYMYPKGLFESGSNGRAYALEKRENGIKESFNNEHIDLKKGVLYSIGGLFLLKVLFS